MLHLCSFNYPVRLGFKQDLLSSHRLPTKSNPSCSLSSQNQTPCSSVSNKESNPSCNGGEIQTFLENVLEGLSKTPRELSSKYLYDQHGSELFDQICELDEYYVTRTEMAIMDECIDEIAEEIGEDVMLVEYGSGSSTKTRKLLRHLKDLAAYVPIDISSEHLLQAVDDLRGLFPDIAILPVVADFTSQFSLPESQDPAAHAVVYFPGSTIGNFPRPDAQLMLEQFSDLVGQTGGLLIGIDLQKDIAVIEAAYNDAARVTAAFNMNLLKRINRELGANFDLTGFQHRAVYREDEGRIEMRLISQTAQTVSIGDQVFEFQAGEHITTEYSHKYTVDGFAKLAAKAGFSLKHQWSDPQEYFAILYFVADAKQA